MNRIGIAASKIAKGDIVLYNAYVLLLVFLFALFIFVIAGAAIMLALMVVGFLVKGLLPQDLFGAWRQIITVCMATLTGVVGFFAVVAIVRNVKFKLSKSKKVR